MWYFNVRIAAIHFVPSWQTVLNITIKLHNNIIGITVRQIEYVSLSDFEIYSFDISFIFHLPLPWASGLPVAIQWAWNLDPSVYWNATGEIIFGSQCASSGRPVAFQWSSIVLLCKLTQDCHWNTTGCYHQPVWFRWHSSVLVAPLVFQCFPMMQINTGSPLEHHWVLASASVVPVASQCTCGSSGLSVWSVQWYPSVLTEFGLEVIWSGHYPACDPSCIQLVWWELFEINWFHLTCNPK